METVGGVGAVVGLAVPIFQSAKYLRDRMKLVAFEKSEVAIVLVEYEKEISHLASLYNDHSALLDQHSLSADLAEIAKILRKLNNSLPAANTDYHVKKKLPSLKEIWRAGDIRDLIKAENDAICRIRGRWQMRLQVCLLASSVGIHSRLDSHESGMKEIKSMLERVMQTMSMLQHGRVRERARSLSVHSQVEPAGFKSQTTSVIANTSPTDVSFSILSPSTALAYDQIKLRLEEYRKLLASNKDTIELPTENGKIVLCRKEASGMEPFLDQAEALLRDIVKAPGTSMLVVLHRVRDLSKVLDHLKLEQECRLAGDCALELAVVLGQRSPEFKRERAETLALIAGLSFYRPRACGLFDRAVTICEEEVAMDASIPNKMRLFTVSARAGCWSKDHPDRGAQWLKRAVQLINAGLPPTNVPPYLCSIIYNTYLTYLSELGQYADAVETCRSAVSLQYTLVSNDPVKHTSTLVRTFMTMANSHSNLREYHHAIDAYKSAEQYCRAVSNKDPLHYNSLLAQVLHQRGITLSNLNRHSEAAGVQRESVSHFRSLARTRTDDKALLCSALHNYGNSCHKLGNYKDAVLAFTESIQLADSLPAEDLTAKLVYGFHNMANSFDALNQHDRANAAASKALELNDGQVLQHCSYSPSFSSCFVCRRALFFSSWA